MLKFSQTNRCWMGSSLLKGGGHWPPVLPPGSATEEGEIGAIFIWKAARRTFINLHCYQNNAVHQNNEHHWCQTLGGVVNVVELYCIRGNYSATFVSTYSVYCGSHFYSTHLLCS
jgi:hypothetical protein